MTAISTKAVATTADIAAVTPASIGAAPETRTITAGTGLSGGGDLSADRTLSVDTSTIASRSYVDATVGGLLYKAACRVVSTANVASLSGYPTIDGVTIGSGDTNKRVLLTAQSDAKQNGPWITASGSWTRPSPNEIQASAAFPVAEGTTYHDTIWYVTTNDPITADATDIALARATMTVTASGITDATSAGQNLLTASDAASQRYLLGLGTSSTRDVGTSSGTVAAGDDSRLSNARTPTSHASTHATGGSDAIAPSDIGAVPTSRTLAGLDLSADRSASDIRTALSTDTTTDTRTPTDGTVTLTKLAAPVLAALETTVTLPFAPGQHEAPLSGADIVGMVYFLPSRYAVTGLTTTLTVEAVGYVQGGTLTLDVLDVTSGLSGASSVLGAAVTWTETDPTRKTASITLPGAGKIYVAKISKSSISGAYLSALNLLVDRS